MAVIQHSPQTMNFGVVAPGHSIDSRATFRIPIEALASVSINNHSSDGGFSITRVRTYEVVPGTEHLPHPLLELTDEMDGSASFDVVAGDVIEVSVRFSPPTNGTSPTKMVSSALSFRAIPKTARGRWGATIPLFAEVGREIPTIKTPWAVLLCKWSDDTSEPFERQFYTDLFTGSGAGTMNMVDFFLDASHRLIDTSGSQVFGWLDLKKKKSEYTGSGANSQGRQDLVNWARQAASLKGNNLTGFAGVVVITNVFVDVWGSGGQVVSGGNRIDGVVSPSILGQEMGHGYGLAHSRADGSIADYQDQWDVMSTATAFMTPNARYIWVGPGLNAWNMAGRGWLDESRVWNAGDPFIPVVSQITLRPLVRYDLPGLLAARVGEYLVEFRVKEGWDAGIPEAAVLVHRFEGNQSYIMRAIGERQDLVKGSVFQFGDVAVPFIPWSRIEVVDINASEHTTTVRIVHRGANSRRLVANIELDPLALPDSVPNNDRAIIIVGGKSISVPPRSPSHQILLQLAAMEESALTPSCDAVRQAALTSIAGHVESHLGNRRVYHQPATRPVTGDSDALEERKR